MAGTIAGAAGVHSELPGDTTTVGKMGYYGYMPGGEAANFNIISVHCHVP
jgi:hypothetical protein